MALLKCRASARAPAAILRIFGGSPRVLGFFDATSMILLLHLRATSPEQCEAAPPCGQSHPTIIATLILPTLPRLRRASRFRAPPLPQTVSKRKFSRILNFRRQTQTQSGGVKSSTADAVRRSHFFVISHHLVVSRVKRKVFSW